MHIVRGGYKIPYVYYARKHNRCFLESTYISGL